ncbi:histidine kinase N-terminal 7TM domain-containing protein [Haloarculaceae archaeon H-GB2-1]|nr:histidine kinase N-terminal 7TM domain-containing protein [Haloarculaceae archaeon H-GB11]MEA5407325.1 histidine kinase N-terminal 7TM domain-containing protein [Haloarculaceae archaeon H-GB2-1]
MGWQSTPYTIPLAVSAVVSLGLAAYVGVHLRDDNADASLTAIFLLLVSAALWTLGYAVQLAQIDLAGKATGLAFANVGSIAVPVFWILFALVYTGREAWLSRRRLGALLGVSGIVITIQLTNPVHHWFWTATVSWNGSFYVLERSFSAAFYLQLAFFIGIVLAGIYLLFRYILGEQDLYRGQAAALALSPVLPLAATLKFFFGIGPHPGVDLTGIGFVASSGALTFAIMRYRFLDVVPVARNVVVETMRDGYVVVDDDETVVDLNPAARDLLDVDEGKSVAPSLPSSPLASTGTEATEVARGGLISFSVTMASGGISTSGSHHSTATGEGESSRSET